MPSFAQNELSFQKNSGKGRGFRHYLKKFSLDCDRMLGGHALVLALFQNQFQMSVLCTTMP